MTSPLNKRSADLDFEDLLRLKKREVMLELNCHAIASVQKIDFAKRLLDAKILYNKTFTQYDADGKTSIVTVEYPLLVDCPFIILGGGTTGLTFPIKVGDECVILFNDRDIDNYVAGAKSGPVASNRLHSFSDALALVGFIEPDTYDPDRATLYNGQTSVGVGANKIRIKNATTTLNTLLQDLCTQLQTLTVTGVTSGPGTSGPPANAAAIANIATQIAGLLE